MGDASLVRARVTAALIILALLAQVLALVRHSTMVVSYTLAHGVSSTAAELPDALARDLAASICHPGGKDLDEAVPSDKPAPHGDPKANCPLCNGLATATLLPPPDVALIEVLALGKIIAFPAFDERLVTHRLIRPRSRGPPAAVASLPA